MFTSSLCQLCVSFLLRACDGRMLLQLLSAGLFLCHEQTRAGTSLSGDRVSPTQQSLVMRLDPCVCGDPELPVCLCSLRPSQKTNQARLKTFI